MEGMKLKLKDEMKNLALKRKKEEMKEWLSNQTGIGSRLDRLLLRLRNEIQIETEK